LPFGTGLAPDAAGQSAYRAFAGQVAPAEALANQQDILGRQRAISLGVNPRDLDTLQRYGEDIRNIRLDVSQKQVALQAYEYNQQLFIAKRNLSDLVGLTGKQGSAQASTVGLLEKQNLELSRQATQI